MIDPLAEESREEEEHTGGRKQDLYLHIFSCIYCALCTLGTVQS